MNAVQTILGSLAALALLALWLFKRYGSKEAKIAKLKGQVDEITQQILVELQKRPVDMDRIHGLNVDRERLSGEIARLSGSGA